MTYKLTLDASNDIDEITQYSIEQWGSRIGREYISALGKKLNTIGDDSVIKQEYSALHPNAYVLRFRKHLIFYLSEQNENPIIFGIIHQNRNVLRILEKRLT